MENPALKYKGAFTGNFVIPQGLSYVAINQWAFSALLYCSQSSVIALPCFPLDFLKTTEILLSVCVILFECKHKLISKQNIIPKRGTIQFNAISIYGTSSISPRYNTNRLTRQVRRVRCIVTEDETCRKISFQLNPMNSRNYFLNHQIIHLFIKYVLISFTCQTLSQAMGI